MSVDTDARNERAIGRFRALTNAVVAPILRTRLRADEASKHLSRARNAYTRVAAAQASAQNGMTSPVGLTLAELADELRGSPSVDQLRTLRRTFAATRHPDRVAIGDRMQATIEMQTANDLIERAIENATA